MTITKSELLRKAKNATKNSIPTYSDFKVGAALVTSDNKIYTGCNFENASMGLTICAERVALFKALSEGKRKFKAIAIASSGNSSVFPCGPCRQFLAEFNKNLIVYVEHDKKRYKMIDLIPHVFTMDQME